MDRVFLMRPPTLADVRRHLFPIADACVRRGVRQIAFLSLQVGQANRSTPAPTRSARVARSWPRPGVPARPSWTRVTSAGWRRPIRYTRPREQDYLALLAAKGHPDDDIAVQRMIHRIVRLNVSALPNRTIRRLTGQPATTLRQFVQDHRSVWDA